LGDAECGVIVGWKDGQDQLVVEDYREGLRYPGDGSLGFWGVSEMGAIGGPSGGWGISEETAENIRLVWNSQYMRSKVPDMLGLYAGYDLNYKCLPSCLGIPSGSWNFVWTLRGPKASFIPNFMIAADYAYGVDASVNAGIQAWTFTGPVDAIGIDRIVTTDLGGLEYFGEAGMGLYEVGFGIVPREYVHGWIGVSGGSPLSAKGGVSGSGPYGFN
jgi:hypothetical protein